VAQKVCLELEYDGSAYHGWQRQREEPTVQAVLEGALRTILREPVGVVGQGRTDAGVHAEAQTAHAQVPEGTDLDDLRKRLNGLLGPNCAVHRLVTVPEDFHARFSALSRTYRYQIVRRPAPLKRRTHWLVEGSLDLDRVHQALPLLQGEHDFGWFGRHSREMDHTRCHVRGFTLEGSGELLTFRITANRFLHNMVRRLVGELVELARGRWDRDDLTARIDHPGPAEAGLTAPAHGLLLERVEYPKDLLKRLP
jgi:tRNA pseudouridine38-40 synthase